MTHSSSYDPSKNRFTGLEEMDLDLQNPALGAPPRDEDIAMEEADPSSGSNEPLMPASGAAQPTEQARTENIMAGLEAALPDDTVSDTPETTGQKRTSKSPHRAIREKLAKVTDIGAYLKKLGEDLAEKRRAREALAAQEALMAQGPPLPTTATSNAPAQLPTANQPQQLPMLNQPKPTISTIKPVKERFPYRLLDKSQLWQKCAFGQLDKVEDQDQIWLEGTVTSVPIDYQVLLWFDPGKLGYPTLAIRVPVADPPKGKPYQPDGQRIDDTVTLTWDANTVGPTNFLQVQCFEAITFMEWYQEASEESKSLPQVKEAFESDGRDKAMVVSAVLTGATYQDFSKNSSWRVLPRSLQDRLDLVVVTNQIPYFRCRVVERLGILSQCEDPETRELEKMDKISNVLSMEEIGDNSELTWKARQTNMRDVIEAIADVLSFTNRRQPGKKAELVGLTVYRHFQEFQKTRTDFCVLLNKRGGIKFPIMFDTLSHQKDSNLPLGHLTIKFDTRAHQRELDAVAAFCSSTRTPVVRLRQLLMHREVDTENQGNFDVRSDDPKARLFERIMEAASKDLNETQSEVVRKLTDIENGVLAVIGPPGTGKTKVASAAIVAMAEQGRKQVVCAPSNATVDNMLLAVVEEAKKSHKELKLLRSETESREKHTLIYEAMRGRPDSEQAQDDENVQLGLAQFLLKHGEDEVKVAEARAEWERWQRDQSQMRSYAEFNEKVAHIPRELTLQGQIEQKLASDLARAHVEYEREHQLSPTAEIPDVEDQRKYSQYALLSSSRVVARRTRTREQLRQP
ncbi:MAG: hypothetical protein Q9166_005220 [cf. Caloplaca sp. 2 TL-2023]